MGSRLQVLGLGALTALLAVGTIIALLPEPPAIPLTSSDGWEVRGHAGRSSLGEFAKPWSQLRRSAVASPAGVLYRSWTPDAGVSEIEVASPPFRPARHLSIVVTGTTRTESGRNHAFLSCSTSSRQWPVFLGSVNTNVAEAIVSLPAGACSGDLRVHLTAGDGVKHVGVGTVFEISTLSAWKSSFVGLLPYWALSILVPAAIGLAGAAAGSRRFPGLHPLLTAVTSIGLAATVAFFVVAILGRRGSPLVLVAVAVALAVLVRAAGIARLRSVAADLAPYGKVWAFASFAYFALLSAARNGLAHWEPCYRFWPASWSSDHELPWIFAEALRTGYPVGGLFLPWFPTDRPPLMSGAHLLLGQLFAAMQWSNDGDYLRGLAYNAASVSFNALWIPATLFLLVSALRVPARRASLVVAIVGTLPFALFNTVYGWPKALGAAFGIAATATALLAVRSASPQRLPEGAAAFGALSGLGLLAHGSGALFVAPVGAWFCLRALLRRPRALAAGILAGGLLLASWGVYERVVLPSPGTVTKYALTGEFGFGNGKSLLAMVVDRYAALSAGDLLRTKLRMLLQPLLPIPDVFLNADRGADSLGALRAWDFALLSGGNAAVLLAGLAALLWKPGTGPIPGCAHLDRGAVRVLVLFGAATWLLLAALFLAPLSVHHWPYAAVFVVGSAGLAWLACTAGRAFRVLAAGTALYSGIVWFLAPLWVARDLDLVALLALIGAAGEWTRRLLTASADADADRATPLGSLESGGPPV